MNKTGESAKIKIDEAFLKLYEEKNIDRITIKEITERAEVYRGTFYYYYNDIYEIYAQMENRMTEIIESELSEIIVAFIEGNITENIKLLEDFYYQYENLISLFLIKKPNIKMMNQIKEIAKKIVINKLGLDYYNLPDDISYVIEFIASGQQGLITKWLKDSKKMDIQSFGDIIKTCTQSSIQYIVSYANANKII